jgi:bifunctional non-homologous end joining protein LigD
MPYVVIDDVSGLITLAQWGIMEIHLWGSKADDLERPDRVVFDLDPGEGVPWKAVRDAARELRSTLAELNLKSWIKTTGGKGLHVVVPIARRNSWDEVKAFAQGVATRMAVDSPDRYIATASKSARSGLIYIDWLRNARSATWVSPWSLRARASAGVSAPISWEALGRVPGGDAVTIQTARKIPPMDPWADLLTSRQRLLKSTIQLVGR